MADDLYTAMGRFAYSDVTRKRCYGGLLAWADAIVAEPLPADPPDDVLRQRILAERTPTQADYYASRIIGYLLQEEVIRAALDDLLTHESLITEEQAARIKQVMDAGLALAAPKLAAFEIQAIEVAGRRQQL